MRAIITALVLIFVTAPLAAQELKPFDFEGYVSGESIPKEKLKGCGKGEDVTCIVPLVKLSDVYVGYMLTTHQNMLSTLYVDASTNSYQSLLAAFTAKYGAPCATSTTVWKNAAGAVLDNPTFAWCFRSGKLQVSKYGSRLDKMGISYEDANKVPQAAPVINF